MRRLRASKKRTLAHSSGVGRSRPAYLFVYGTLTRGEKLHKHLRKIPGARFVGPARIRGELYSIPGDEYPGAVQNGNAGGFVHGELYLLSRPDPALRLLDQLEGCDEGLFRRQRAEAFAAWGKRPAWVYFYARPLKGAELIPSGHFNRS